MASCFSSSCAAITEKKYMQEVLKSAQPVLALRMNPFSFPSTKTKQNKKNGFHLKAFENKFDATEA